MRAGVPNSARVKHGAFTPGCASAKVAAIHAASSRKIVTFHSGYLPCLFSHCCIRRCTLGRDNSANCSSKPGLFVRKRFRFHSQMHAWAEGAGMADGTDVAILKNVRAGLRNARNTDMPAEHKKETLEFRDGLGALLEIFHEPRHLRTLLDTMKRATKINPVDDCQAA
jgi:hypothetical protein